MSFCRTRSWYIQIAHLLLHTFILFVFSLSFDRIFQFWILKLLTQIGKLTKYHPKPYSWSDYWNSERLLRSWNSDWCRHSAKTALNFQTETNNWKKLIKLIWALSWQFVVTVHKKKKKYEIANFNYNWQSERKTKEKWKRHRLEVVSNCLTVWRIEFCTCFHCLCGYVSYQKLNGVDNCQMNSDISVFIEHK